MRTKLPALFVAIGIGAVAVMALARGKAKRTAIGGTYTEAGPDGQERTRGWNEPASVPSRIKEPTYFHGGWFYTLHGPYHDLNQARTVLKEHPDTQVSLTQDKPNELDFRWIGESGDHSLPEEWSNLQIQQHPPEGW
ncbi:MAG: hypothetical protein JSV86_18520 [Gemmatimonadota bacterium]|nr:MAG: hypothetical protein JSV86_18520 [Gemmatimonadota bacterium]